jgi:hypothetical protein
VTPRIANPKEFWAGLIYVAFGAGTILNAKDYTLGSLHRMGPGYFPIVLAVLLLLFGVAAILRSFATRGTPLARGGWIPLLYVVGANILFALLLPRAGLPIALLVLALLSAAASHWFKWDMKALAGLVALIAICTIVFVKILQVPMPVLGSWFGLPG